MAIKDYNKTAKSQNFAGLTGGLDSRHTPLLIEASDKNALKAQTAKNVDFFGASGFRNAAGCQGQATMATSDYSVRGGFQFTLRDGTPKFLVNTFSSLKVYGAAWSAPTTLSPFPVAAGYNTFFQAFKDRAIIFNDGAVPSVYDGASTGVQALGYRMSPVYSSNYTEATISSISGATITFTASQPASGLYIGKQIVLVTGTDYENAYIQSFVTAANPGTGTASYYVSSMTLTAAPKTTTATAVRWNGATLALGTGGSAAITSATTVTTVSILAVTTLLSGGLRASEFSIDIPTAGGPYSVNFTNLAQNSTSNGGQFSTDIGALATTYYITPLFDPGASTSARTGSVPTLTYYRVISSAANIDTTINPFANSTTSVKFYKVATTTQPTLLSDTGYPANYFTAQIDAPKSGMGVLFKNQIFLARNSVYPNRLYTSASGALGVYSSAGGTFGSYYDLETQDDDTIQGVAVHNEFLYVFKKRSIFIGEYTSNAVAPFSFRRLQATFGTQYPGSIVVCDFGICYISARGPAYVSGSIANLLPGADNIQNAFANTQTILFTPYAGTFSCLDQNKQQIYWGLQENTANSDADVLLVYDIATKAFYTRKVSNKQTTAMAYFPYFAYATGTFIFIQATFGSIAPIIATFDPTTGGESVDGTSVAVDFKSAWISLTGGSDKKQLDRVWVRGDVQASGTATMTFMRDFSNTIVRSISIDLTDARLKAGISFPLNMECKDFCFEITNSGKIGIDSIQVDWQPRGPRV